MKKLIFTILITFVLGLVITVAKAQEQLIVQMTTEKAVDSYISFEIEVAKPGITLKIDYENGGLVTEMFSYSSSRTIKEKVRGATIKIYGTPTDLLRFSCSSNSLSSLDVSNNTDLIELDCSYNTLSSLDLMKTVSDFLKK
jgi:hypothetical protein